MPVLMPDQIMEFRSENRALLRGFRQSMLRYAADLNSKIAGCTVEDFTNKTNFFIRTEIVPALDELREAMNRPARPLRDRIVDAVKVAPSIAGAYLAGGPAGLITKIITAYGPLFLSEISARGDQKETLKRSGLYYLLELQKFHDKHS
jgi:hypothetical protein